MVETASVTRPVRLAGRNLHLNAASKFGAVVVEALDLDGNRLARSERISGDAIDLPVPFEPGANVPKGAPVKLRFTLENARLFSLWCLD
jgi:hypothetical protein